MTKRPRRPRNSRTQCQDCLKPCMTARPTANTPKLIVKGYPFCAECLPFWERVSLDVPKGQYTYVWKCLECKQTMPLVEHPAYTEGAASTYAIDWVHAETCDALHQPCACKVRNKRPSQIRCGPCSRPVHVHLAKAADDIKQQLGPTPKYRPNPGKRSGMESSPGQDNAIRAMEGN